jgi:hypothetical protein
MTGGIILAVRIQVANPIPFIKILVWSVVGCGLDKTPSSGAWQTTADEISSTPTRDLQMVNDTKSRRCSKIAT